MSDNDKPDDDFGQTLDSSLGKSRTGTRKNDAAWAAFFDRTDTLAQIEKQGFAYITAEQLNALKMRDARLLTKLDTLDDRPKVFREHELTIFPVKNGEYIVFRDPQNKTYFRLSEDQLELTPREYRSKIDLTAFDAFPRLQRLNESQALDFALISSLLCKFTCDDNLHLVIRGRTFSGEFTFDLPQAAHQVHVSSVQIEVDGGYESRDTIYLVEAKTGRRADFHIRQLYYPYLEWSRRSRKRIVPIFFFVTNGKFYFFEFFFDGSFGDLSVLRSESYVINESPVAQIRLSELIGRITSIGEPEVPFPQANDLDKVVDLLALIDSTSGGYAVEGIRKSAIAVHFEFDERQGDYYANAGVYLDLLKRGGAGFVLTNRGSLLIGTRSLARRIEILVEQMLQRPVLRDAFELLWMRGLDLEQVGLREIADIIRRHTDLSGSTPIRRASTVKRWLQWVKDNTEIEW
jgi:hypothetical protein